MIAPCIWVVTLASLTMLVCPNALENDPRCFPLDFAHYYGEPKHKPSSISLWTVGKYHPQMAGSLYHISFCSTRLKQQVFLKVGLQLPRFPGIQVDTPPCGGLVTSSPKIVVPTHLAFSRTWPVKVPISRTFIYQGWYCPWTAAAPLLLGAPFSRNSIREKSLNINAWYTWENSDTAVSCFLVWFKDLSYGPAPQCWELWSLDVF